MPFSSFGCAFFAPRIMWVDGLVKSKSKSPTLQPFRASVNASVVATRLLPTPPLPDETAIIRLIRFNLSFIMLVLASTIVYRVPFMFLSQTPRPSVISKSGLPHFRHLMYACATSGTKCIASAVLLSSFCFVKSHVLPHALHWSVVFARAMRNLAFLKLAGLSCEKANLSMSNSTCCSSPTLTVTSVTSFNFSFVAICVAAVITASAKAHSCIKKP